MSNVIDMRGKFAGGCNILDRARKELPEEITELFPQVEAKPSLTQSPELLILMAMLKVMAKKQRHSVFSTCFKASFKDPGNESAYSAYWVVKELCKKDDFTH
ncbi:hypothetical protein [Parasphingorhabdus cellanae]|uniref:Uncharacterized protein n=1 Tax=Parasphingorhabdus cellanae TaxID=2806553 RepID=A0ABX7T883_9SPHN|nr:hypothetical protein [Parasphingorhabdus cellanae]QTD57296.1 hypothetical protein J4G78_07130 [Parasphingorhabdus cellanae]